MKVSEIIKQRLQAIGASFHANENISAHIMPGELQALEQEVEEAMQSVLEALVIDTEKDHNTKETARRVAKMYMREVFKGRYEPRPKITDFPNAKEMNELYTVGPITIRSACSHHMVPIIGKAWIGMIPSDKVIGLSKFNRLTEWVMSRPHIQEEASVMLADEIMEAINPKGLAVVMRAEHMCMTWRGVRDVSSMTNCVLRGLFEMEPSLKAEFYSTIRGQGF